MRGVTFGQYLKRERVRRGLFQGDVAGSKLNRSEISRLERSRVRGPNLTTLVHIAERLEMKAWQLVKKWEES